MMEESVDDIIRWILFFHVIHGYICMEYAVGNVYANPESRIIWPAVQLAGRESEEIVFYSEIVSPLLMYASSGLDWNQMGKGLLPVRVKLS